MCRVKKINIKKGDFILSEIRRKVGAIERKVFVYGFTNNNECEFEASPDIVWWVREFLHDMGRYKKKTNEIKGRKRLGISDGILENEPDFVVEMIQELTKAKEMDRCVV
jgi:hypothetical protein